MAFDEAIKRLSQDIDKNGGQEKYQKEVIATLKSLQKEYAPTVEMTSGNKATFIQEGDSLSKLLTGYFGFDALYWGDVSERKVAQAWLYPETIKVVDE